MTIRDTLLANISAALATTSVSHSEELPWLAGGVDLYNKNMKRFYLSAEQQDITQNQITLDRNDVFQTETTVLGYITVDAKNPPADMDTVITICLNGKNSIDDHFITDCLMTSEFAEDRLTYVFEYKFTKINLQGDP